MACGSMVSIRRMTLDDFSSLSSEQQEALDLDEGNHDDNDDLASNFEESCYIVFKVKIDDEVYTAYQGFPGATAMGVFKLDENTWYYFGEGGGIYQTPNEPCGYATREEIEVSPVFRKFFGWYNIVTDKGRDYEIFQVPY